MQRHQGDFEAQATHDQHQGQGRQFLGKRATGLSGAEADCVQPQRAGQSVEETETVQQERRSQDA